MKQFLKSLKAAWYQFLITSDDIGDIYVHIEDLRRSTKYNAEEVFRLKNDLRDIRQQMVCPKHDWTNCFREMNPLQLNTKCKNCGLIVSLRK